MTRARLFKVFMWAWIVSIPLSLIVGFTADKLQQNELDNQGPVTLQNIQTYGTQVSPTVQIARTLNALVILYVALGWIPFVIFGILNASQKRKGT